MNAADGPAVNTGCHDAAEESPVEAWVAAQDCLITDFVVQFHRDYLIGF
jgi:hypothetical protein